MRTSMKAYSLISLSLVLLFSGCADRSADARRAEQEAESKAQAEAARREMDAVPKAFKSRDYFKKNEPEKAEASAAEVPRQNP